MRPRAIPRAQGPPKFSPFRQRRACRDASAGTTRLEPRFGAGASPPYVAATTEIIVVGGKVYRVEGDTRDVERTILDAARGSIMQFAWLLDADTGERIGLNPDHVVTLRATDP